jgi:hypothetical protein
MSNDQSVFLITGETVGHLNKKFTIYRLLTNSMISTNEFLFYQVISRVSLYC